MTVVSTARVSMYNNLLEKLKSIYSNIRTILHFEYQNDNRAYKITQTNPNEKIPYENIGNSLYKYIYLFLRSSPMLLL
jgi:arabinogalactan endo-1,4-beta-galactosidase